MSPGEAERLRRLPHLAVALYAIALRPRAGVDGWVRGVTWRELCAELTVPPHGRDPGVAPYRQQLQRALAHLVSAGLVDGAGEGFEFAARCILACNVRDNVREKPHSSAGFQDCNVRDNVRAATSSRGRNVRDTKTEKPSRDRDMGSASTGGNVRADGAVDLIHGSPLPPSPFSPLINPPISPPNLPPSTSIAHDDPTRAEFDRITAEAIRTGRLDRDPGDPAPVASERCAKCRGTGRGWSQGIPGTVPIDCPACKGRGHVDTYAAEPAFALTMQPGEDPPPEPAAPAPQRGRIQDTWVPTSATLKALEQKGVPPRVALAEVGHFVLWWQNATQREGSKRASGWQLAFLNWCKKLSPTKNAPVTGREGTTGGRNYADRSTQQQPRRSASERNRDATRQHFQGRTDFPDD